MKILNTTCRRENQRDVLARYLKPQAAITPHILCISLLALLTGCTMDIAIKPDKVSRGGSGTAGPNRPPVGTYPGGVYPGGVYPGHPHPSPIYQDPSIGGFAGAQPVSLSNPPGVY